MTAAIVYQGVANDNSIVGGSGQYNFGGTPSAQAFSISIPSDYDAEANPVYSIGTGLLRSSGFGSAYGAHRYITREKGATPNMNATVGTAFFGQLPEIALNVAIAKKYGIKFDITPAEADAKVIFKNSEGTVIEPDAEGYYYGIYLFIKKKFRNFLSIAFNFLLTLCSIRYVPGISIKNKFLTRQSVPGFIKN